MRHKKLWDSKYNNPFMIPFTSGVHRFAGEDPQQDSLPYTAFRSMYLGVRAFCTILYYCIQHGNDPRQYVLDYLPDCEFRCNILACPIEKHKLEDRFVRRDLHAWLMYFTDNLPMSEYDSSDMMYIESLGYTFLYQENYVQKR